LWKNCPKAWAGSYTGKPGTPSILLEGVVDYHMFFWHVSYGYILNVLNMAPLLKSNVGEEEPITVQQPNDLVIVQTVNGNNSDAGIRAIGVTNAPHHLQHLVTRKDRFKELADEGEHQRLHHALMNKFG
jgi:hypothetical protein